jgi:hypothetical protein
MATAGRILIMPKGAWNESVSYENLDLVSHNSRAWIAKKTSVGIEPSDANAEYWHDLFNDAFDITFHTEDKQNPHGVTCEQIGAADAEHTHSASDVGAAPADHTHTAVDVGASVITTGTEDLTPGVSALAAGTFHFVLDV